MNASAMVQMIGRTGEIHARGEMSLTVRVTDVKVAYGQVRYLVTPVAGCGSAWVDADSLVPHPVGADGAPA